MTSVLAALLAAAAALVLTLPQADPGDWPARARSVLHHVTSRMASRGHRLRTRAAARAALAEIAADVQAGQPPRRAAERAFAAASPPVTPRTLAALRWSGDVAAALRDDARTQSQPMFAAAAACWTVAEERGAGLARALSGIVAQDRRAEEVRRQLEAHLAAPRATARMLALLPLVGIVLGLAIGGDPLGWLLGGPFGWMCLVLGGLLVVVGVAWSTRIAARAERLL